jgi:integrase
MTVTLAEVMGDWFAKHPGGQFTICHTPVLRGCRKQRKHLALTRSEAHDHFKRPLGNSKWDKVKGFHVFRHSFASNLAAAGVDQRIIDEWMGHQTDQMRRRYRHLFPDQQREAIESVFGRNGK